MIIFNCLILILINSDIYSFSNDFKSLLHVSAFFQIIILLSNLLPIPGYDGWNAIFSLIGKKIGNVFSKLLLIPLTLGFIICVYSLDMFRDELNFAFAYLFVLSSQFNLDENLIIDGFSYLQLIDIDTLDLFRERFFDFVSKIIGSIKDQLQSLVTVE